MRLFKMKTIILIVSPLFIKLNGYSKQNSSSDDSLRIYFNGIYIYELKCGDDFQYDSLVKNGICLKNKETQYAVDSMVAHIFYKFGEVVTYQIKGNKLPSQFNDMVRNRKYGVSIWIEKLFFKENNKVTEILNNNVILFCNFNNSLIKDFKTK